MNAKEHWRLLKAGEVRHDGDQFWHPSHEMWCKCISTGEAIIEGEIPHRRRCHFVQEPIAIKEMGRPDFPMYLAWHSKRQQWDFIHIMDVNDYPSYTHWLPLPPAPIAPPNPNKQAFRAWREREENKSATLEDAWLAALEYAKK